ncbi:hypothetical protein SAMN05421788_10668 [Filimonas lacunae]|uniref:Uncharacterized protein n=1 Tax=Filimonas lacunae TaxID=477680 RepID=A0A1N7QMJ9_9BACT|nr:hypothetical protein SAMN05421788_10668 [Filimonas lacunae]
MSIVDRETSKEEQDGLSTSESRTKGIDAVYIKHTISMDDACQLHENRFFAVNLFLSSSIVATYYRCNSKLNSITYGKNCDSSLQT